MRDKILELTREVAELRIKVEFLEDKNKELQKSATTPKPRTRTRKQ